MTNNLYAIITTKKKSEYKLIKSTAIQRLLRENPMKYKAFPPAIDEMIKSLKEDGFIFYISK